MASNHLQYAFHTFLVVARWSCTIGGKRGSRGRDLPSHRILGLLDLEVQALPAPASSYKRTERLNALTPRSGQRISGCITSKSTLYVSSFFVLSSLFFSGAADEGLPIKKRRKVPLFFSFLSFLFFKQRPRRGGNPPTWPPRHCSPETSFIEKRWKNIKGKNICLDVCSKLDGMNTIAFKISLWNKISHDIANMIEISLRFQKYHRKLLANVETKDMLVRPKM